MLATTAYDSPDSSYTYAIARSREALTKAGLANGYLLLSGNCSVDDARNTVLREFLQSDCTELVFLDADVSWEPEHLVRLASHDCDIVGGVYPYRRDSAGPAMPVRTLPGKEIDENGLLEVEGLPTGFLRIRRHVIETLARISPEFRKDNGAPYPLVFERDLLNGGRRSGDIRFCMRWRERGGKLYADTTLHLGHVAKMVIRDSLAACIRRQAGTTLAYVADLIRKGEETADTYAEAIRYDDNRWGARADALALAVVLARKSAGDILEIGSGLSTILMAAAAPASRVWCMEHSPEHSIRLQVMAKTAGVGNIGLIEAPLKDGWYDLADEKDQIPQKFAVAFVDGPPRMLGDRMVFFEKFGQKVEVILVDDADDPHYANQLWKWAEANNRKIEFGDARAAVITRKGFDYGQTEVDSDVGLQDDEPVRGRVVPLARG